MELGTKMGYVVRNMITYQIWTAKLRHHKKGYHREEQNHRHLRKAYDGLKMIGNSPQNKDQKKLYHRAMKVLEKYDQTPFWQLSFERYTDAKKGQRHRLVFTLEIGVVLLSMIYWVAFMYYKTDLSQEEVSTREVQTNCKQLIEVERCFRHLKHT